MPVLALDDAADPRFADYRNIPDPELARRRGVFVAEGRLVVRRLLQTSFPCRSVVVTATALPSVEDLTRQRPDLAVYVVPQSVMNAVAGFNIHRGCLAIGERPEAHAWPDLTRQASRMVALERLGNADNVGTVFRSAAAFGLDGVLLGPDCADPLYRKAIRTSMGAALQVPFADASPWPDVLSTLRRDGWTIVGLTPSDTAVPLAELRLASPGQRTLMLLGHEGEGLTTETMRACTHLARIPMARGIDSLNAGVAAGVALYELTRQASASLA